MPYKFEITERPTQPVLSSRMVVPVQGLPQLLGKVYHSIIQHLCELGEQPAGPAFAAYYNMDMQALDVEAGFIVSGKLPGKGDIQAGEIPGGKAATYLYTGPYDGMEPVYNALFQWIGENGHKPAGTMYEMYLNGPDQVSPQELETQIVIPLT